MTLMNLCLNLAAVVAITVATAEPLLAQRQEPGSVTGHVRDSSGAPIPGARVQLRDLDRTVVARSDGAFAFVQVPRGTHVLQALRVGYAASTLDTVHLESAALVHNFTLSAVHVPLSQIVVTPGSYSVLDQGAPSQQVLTRDELLTRPQLVEDLFRSLNRLPGFSGSDFSSRVRIRNSAPDEVLVTLDGLELVEPFHMKDFESSLTIFDQDAVSRVEVNTGGFGAAYGNRGAGLILLSSAQPSKAGMHAAVGVSLANARVHAEGTFASGKGGWVVSARRGYLDLVFKLLDLEDVPDPTYYDVFGKLQYRLGTNHLLALHALSASDKMKLSIDDATTLGSSRYGNRYLWTTLQSQWNERLRSTTLLSVGALDWKRDGSNAEFFNRQPYPNAAYRDRRTLDVWSARQDWTVDITPKVSVAFGGEARGEEADYDYFRIGYDRVRINQTVTLRDSTVVRIARDANDTRVSGYSALRMRPITRLALEVGLRADQHSLTDQTTVAPRLSASYDIASNTVMRGAWGRYPQAHSLQDLDVAHGDSVFARAEQSEQRILGLEHRPAPGWSLRTEVFERRIRDPRSRWLSADGDIDQFPEGKNDLVKIAPDSSRVRGVEALVSYDLGGRLRATAWYAFSDGRSYTGAVETGRPFQEKHSAAIDLGLRTHRGWTYALAWTFHSGWPSIPASFRVDTLAPGQYATVRNPSNAVFTERLASYFRVDARVSRRFSARNGAVSVFAEVFNLLNTTNQRGWSYDTRVNNGSLVVTREAESFLSRLPSLGIRWEF